MRVKLVSEGIGCDRCMQCLIVAFDLRQAASEDNHVWINHIDHCRERSCQAIIIFSEAGDRVRFVSGRCAP